MRRDNGAPAMNMEFGIVLAGKTFWRREENDEPFVDGFARGRIAEGCKRRRAGIGKFSRDAFDNPSRRRT